jgi:hypothetical protein
MSQGFEDEYGWRAVHILDQQPLKLSIVKLDLEMLLKPTRGDMAAELNGA